MALSVARVNNPTFKGIGTSTAPKISGVIRATPGSNGFAGLGTGPTLQQVGPTPQLPNVYGNAGGYAPAPVYAPKLDIAAVNAQARSAAESAVNPYYTKVLNEFLTQQGIQRQQQQQQADMNIKNIEDSLKQTLEGNALNKTRTSEDVATNEAQIAQTADQSQTDTGQQFAADRLLQAKNIAQSGLTGGLGAQQKEASQLARNTGEARQAEQFQQEKVKQELFKTRTFEDLAKSDVLATSGAEKGKTQEKFNLDTYIQHSQAEEQARRNELEKARLQEIAQNSQSQAKLLFNNYLAGISNPAQRAAAISTYGGVF